MALTATVTVPETVTDNPRVGFTPFAFDHLITRTDAGDGFPTDSKKRSYILGGTDTHGKRVRREVRGSLYATWLVYAEDRSVVRLWVQWKDGKRHLVHRKV